MPVYSTWICLYGIPEVQQNTVQSFRLQNVLSNYYPSEKSLINIDLLLLSEKYDWNPADATVIKFLQAIFKDKLRDNNFNPYLRVNEEIEKEVQVLMTEQEQYEYELEAEKAEGRAEGREEGREEGRAEGKAEGIISAAVKLHMTDAGVLTSMLVDELLITPEQAHEYIKKFLPDRSNDSEE